MIDKIHWLGHSTFKINADKIIYTDPYKLADSEEKADLILITHDHYDHLSQEDIQKIVKPDTKFVAPQSCARHLSGKTTVIKRGDKITIDGVEIEAVPAYNTNKDFHKQETDNVGYVITINGTKIYHAGDTDIISEMKDLTVDIALLPCGGTYTMTAAEVIQAAEIINPKIIVPMHWGTIVGSRSDAELIEKECKNCEVRILDQE